jgi:hypothetical protein
MFELVRETYRYRELIWALAAKELSIRYKRSTLGFLWALHQPGAVDADYDPGFLHHQPQPRHSSLFGFLDEYPPALDVFFPNAFVLCRVNREQRKPAQESSSPQIGVSGGSAGFECD